MEKPKRRLVASVLLAGMLQFLPLIAQPDEAMAQSATVEATGEAVIEAILQRYQSEGTTHFVFEALPQVYAVGAYVHANLPYNMFPWAESYTFSWGTGRQLVIDLQSDRAGYLEARRILEEEAHSIGMASDTREDAFRLAFAQVATSVTYDNSQGPGREEQMLQGAVRDRRAVCNGYATYLAALLNELDIFAYKVYLQDTSNPMDPGHAGVRFYLGEAWWYTDPSSYAYHMQLKGTGYPEYFLMYPTLSENQITGPGNLHPEKAEALRAKLSRQ